MNLKPAQGELNTALTPILADIPKAHPIYDNLVTSACSKSDTKTHYLKHNIRCRHYFKSIELCFWKEENYILGT